MPKRAPKRPPPKPPKKKQDSTPPPAPAPEVEEVEEGVPEVGHLKEIERLKAREQDLQKEISTLKSTKSSMSRIARSTMEAEISELNAELSALNEELSAVKELNDTLNENLFALTEERDALKQKFGEAAADVKRLTVKLEGRDARRKTDGAELKKMEKELKNVKEKNEKILLTFDKKVKRAEEIARRAHAAAVTACEEENRRLQATIQEMGTLGDKARAVVLGRDSSPPTSAPAIPLPAESAASKKKKRTRRRRRRM